MRKAKVGERQQRGVFVSPWSGEQGELILVAVDSSGRRIAERLVPFGVNQLGISDELWELLEARDPEPRTRLRAI